MELLLQSTQPVEKADPFWKNPFIWIRDQNLNRKFWIFFLAALFFDAGFSIYVFLFNLYLLDCGFNERAMGLIGGATTLGSLVGLLPAGVLARKIGLRPLLAFCFIAAPIFSAGRAVWIWEPAQIGLGFLSGLAMCSWGVCFLPAVARLTTEKNRTAAFSLIFSVSILTGMLGGGVCGYLPQWLALAGIIMQAAHVKRLILLVSCAVAFLGLFPALHLRMPTQESPTEAAAPRPGKWFRKWKPQPFLLRFLPLMALWSAVLAAFSPFGNIYLSRDLHISMTQIGLVFSMVQLVQLGMGLVTPIAFRALGLVNGIVATQIVTAVVLGSMAGVHNGRFAIALYLAFSAAQWMSAPGLYNLLMNETPDAERSTAAAQTLFCNALAGSIATASAGIFFTRFGYPPVLLGIAGLAFAAAIAFRLSMTSQHTTLAQP
jgi:MFS family permease